MEIVVWYVLLCCILYCMVFFIKGWNSSIGVIVNLVLGLILKLICRFFLNCFFMMFKYCWVKWIFFFIWCMDLFWVVKIFLKKLFRCVISWFVLLGWLWMSDEMVLSVLKKKWGFKCICKVFNLDWISSCLSFVVLIVFLCWVLFFCNSWYII